MRLFIALNFPSEVRAAIWDATVALRQTDYPIRWVGPDNLHLTLKFLGDVPEERISELRATVSRLCDGHRSFSLAISDVGAFPTPRNPKVIWVGCETTPNLELLQHGVEQECLALGFPIEGRPFRPHVTVGRVRRDVTRNRLHGLDTVLDQVSLALTTNVRSVELMESRLGRAGATYHVMQSQEMKV